MNLDIHRCFVTLSVAERISRSQTEVHASKSTWCSQQSWRMELRFERDPLSISSTSPPTVSGTDNSLSRVLFIFRSSYLFAIGVRSILSLLRHTSQDSGIIPKIPYSLLQYVVLHPIVDTGLSPSLVLHSRRITTTESASIERIPQFCKARTQQIPIWTCSLSFATTNEVAVAFLSSA